MARKKSYKKRRKARSSVCTCNKCSRHRKRRRKVKKSRRMRTRPFFSVSSRLRTRQKGRRAYVVDGRGRVKGSFETDENGAMTRKAARKRFLLQSKRSQEFDLGRNANKVTTLRGDKTSKRAQAHWFLNPSRSDIRTIDTRKGSSPRRLKPRKRSKRKSSRRSSMGRTRSDLR